MSKVILSERAKANSTVEELMAYHDKAPYGSEVGAAFILPRGPDSEEVKIAQVRDNGHVIVWGKNGKQSLSPQTPIVVLRGHLPTVENIGDRRVFKPGQTRVRLGDIILA